MGQIDPFLSFSTTPRHGRRTPKSDRRRYGQDAPQSPCRQVLETCFLPTLERNGAEQQRCPTSDILLSGWVC
jgi:hypothetical protein